jgi:alkylhydroperoxidase family enzyme
MTWIRTFGLAEATGRLKASYEAAVRRAGRVFGIVRAMSPNPATLDASMGLYLAVMYGESPLTRRQREMLAVVVSVQNHCHY